ncbi:MAG: hypothetical protein ACRCZS_02200, partial [Chroococcidiopsis sp.]
ELVKIKLKAGMDVSPFWNGGKTRAEMGEEVYIHIDDWFLFSREPEAIRPERLEVIAASDLPEKPLENPGDQIRAEAAKEGRSVTDSPKKAEAK